MTFARYVTPREQAHDEAQDLAYDSLANGERCIMASVAKVRPVDCGACVAGEWDSEDHTYDAGCEALTF